MTPGLCLIFIPTARVPPPLPSLRNQPLSCRPLGQRGGTRAAPLRSAQGERVDKAPACRAPQHQNTKTSPQAFAQWPAYPRRGGGLPFLGGFGWPSIQNFIFLTRKVFTILRGGGGLRNQPPPPLLRGSPLPPSPPPPPLPRKTCCSGQT